MIERLLKNKTLEDKEFEFLLTTTDETLVSQLKAEARKASLQNFGNIIFARGLIEISNICRNNCLYCGIRAGNTEAERYRLTQDEIIECCKTGAALGFETYVLQGGEDPIHTTEWVETLIKRIKTLYPEKAITLSLGERTESDYQRWFDAGADRYLLRHETADKAHYSKLHPDKMSFDNRIACLRTLKRIGYETGTGMMVGSPYQTTRNLIEDLRFIEALQPEMIGIGPFIHHNQTPFCNFADGSVETTLRLIAILRLMHPRANIPATTSLGTLSEEGRTLGIFAGANVVMPNLSPQKDRAKYSLYNNKIHTDLEAAESRKLLEKQLEDIGYQLK